MPAEPRKQSKNETAERRLQRIGSAAHGVVSRSEALDAGVTRSQIEQRLALGGLLVVHRGVYRVGHEAPSAAALYMAAVKACGTGSGLSGLAACHLLGLRREPPEKVEVTAPTERRVPGLLVHRAREGPLELTLCKGIPVTTPARTLVDSVSRLDDDQLGRACHEAWVRYRCGPRQVEAVLARRRRSPGARRLLRMVAGDDPLVLSRMERRFLSLLRAARRELPASNVRVGSFLVDCRWPHLHLTVELDSYSFHATRRAWERDRRRDREARMRGDELLRYDAGDVFDDPRAMMAEIAARVPRVSKHRGTAKRS